MHHDSSINIMTIIWAEQLRNQESILNWVIELSPTMSTMALRPTQPVIQLLSGLSPRVKELQH
jgi:hypothetical protein